MTDKDNKIIHIYKSFGTEKIIFPKRKVFYIYLAPLGVSSYFNIGDELMVKEEK